MNENSTKMWDIKKLYNQNTFPDDDNSLGYAIDVYQESINKTFKEYLVNFEFLTRVLENYGFIKITTEEAEQLGFPQSVGSFGDLFDNMEERIESERINKNDIGKALNMSVNEKTISFLNNYFIYKKVRNTDAKQLTNQILNVTRHEEGQSKSDSDELRKNIQQPKKRQVKKYKKKLKLPK